MQLPLIDTGAQPVQLLTTKWKSILDPLISKQILQGNLIQASLVTGANAINHLLGRKQVGWILTDVDASVVIYRSQPLNDKTLTLTSGGPANISLWVF